MNTLPSDIGVAVREVFLVPPDFSVLAAPLVQRSEHLVEPHRSVALAFLDNLHGVLRTLSLPFQFTYSQVHSLHWQRILMAERIRARGIDDEMLREPAALEKARAKLQHFLSADGQAVVRDEVLDRLHRLSLDTESLTTAHELTRQGVVLIWSAFEVLSRDLFVLLLNRHPMLTDRLLAHPATRKRFAVEKVDWQTLSSYSFNLSESVGTLLAQRADLDDIQTIREAFGALFPNAGPMTEHLAQERLWFLFQKRNFIVHRSGIVDQHYRVPPVNLPKLRCR